MTELSMMSHPIRRRLVVTLTVFLGLAIVCTASLIAGWTYSLVLLGLFALYTLPGLPWAIAWCGRPNVANPGPVVVGFSLGIVLSLLLCSIAVRFCGWATWVIVFSPMVASVPGCVYLQLRPPGEPRRLRLPRVDTADYVYLASVFVLLLGLLAVPLLRVGHVVGKDHVFHSLFAYDYLCRSGFVSAALRGLPPDNLFTAGQRQFNGYYLYYTLCATVRHVADQGLLALNKTQPPYQLLGASSIYLAVLFVFTLFLNVKAILPSRFACYAAVACGLFAYSYNGFYVMVKRFLAPAIPGLDRLLSSSGLLAFSDVSKGWYRDFLVEQQAVLALILFFTCFLLVAPLRRGVASLFMAIGVGIMLAGSFSSDSAIGTIGVLWFGVFLGWRFVRGEQSERRAVFVTGLITYASAAGALAAALLSGLAPMPSGGSSLSFVPNKMIYLFGPIYLPLDFGPPLLLALAGIFLVYKTRSQLSSRPTAVFAVVSLAVICLVLAACLKYDARLDSSVIIRKAGKVLRFALVVGCGYYFCFLGSRIRGSILLKYPRAVWAVVLLGVPAVAIDCAVFTGMYDDGRTSRISRADYEACDWLRRNTSLGVVVQSLPEYQDGGYETTPVVQIGGRAMALGDELSGELTCEANGCDFLKLKRDVYSLFEPISFGEAEAVLREHSIAYIYVGEHERSWRPGGTDKYYANPQLFPKVYSRNGVDIFLFTNNTKGYTAAR